MLQSLSAMQSKHKMQISVAVPTVSSLVEHYRTEKMPTRKDNAPKGY